MLLLEFTERWVDFRLLCLGRFCHPENYDADKGADHGYSFERQDAITRPEVGQEDCDKGTRVEDDKEDSKRQVLDRKGENHEADCSCGASTYQSAFQLWSDVREKVDFGAFDNNC